MATMRAPRTKELAMTRLLDRGIVSVYMGCVRDGREVFWGGEDGSLLESLGCSNLSWRGKWKMFARMIALLCERGEDLRSLFRDSIRTKPPVG
jgi:hypothetical protein